MNGRWSMVSPLQYHEYPNAVAIRAMTSPLLTSNISYFMTFQNNRAFLTKDFSCAATVVLKILYL